MERFLLNMLLCIALAACVTAQAPAVISDELTAARYDCTLRLLPAANLAAGSVVSLTLEGALRVTLTREQLAVAALEKGKETPCFAVPAGLTPGTEYRLTVLRRDDWVGVMCGDELLNSATIKRGAGNTATLATGDGWKVLESRVQVLEPVAFADNFMRTAEEPGEWTVRGGQWGLQSAWDADPKGNAHRFANAATGANPFAWRGRAGSTESRPPGSVLCTAGKPYWEDYTFTAAVQPAENGAVGMMVNMPNDGDGLLVRWLPGSAHARDSLALYRVSGGKRAQLAADDRGFVPGQWYQLQVVSRLDGTVRVSVDGRELFSVRIDMPRRGGVGLYAEGDGGVFDDVTVYGKDLRQDVLAESQLSHLSRRFLDDANGMAKWTGAQTDWQSAPDAPNRWVHRLDFYGDHWLTVTARPTANKANTLTLALNTDAAGAPESGYRAVVAGDAGFTTVAYTLSRKGQVVARGKGKSFTPGEEYTFRLRRAGATVQLEQDGKVVVRAEDPQPLSGTRLSYCAEGFALTQSALALGANYFDDVFAEAPVAWVGHGAWAQTVRWACSPEWSFLGGYSPGEAALWHKARFTGDQTFQAWLGIIMEYPRERDRYQERYRDLAITICGDGQHPRSGYAGIYGAPDADGRPNARTVLLRNGAEVASCPLTVPPFDPRTHRNWYDLRLVKRGATVEFWVEGRLTLTYADPAPLDGGVPAVWTRNSGITLARARLSSANPPQPRDDTPVVIAAPSYPEWVDIGKPLALDFAQSWSASGRPVTLRAVAEETPKTDANGEAVTIDRTRLTFAPTSPGWYWYRLTAGDGNLCSEDYHLLTPVFKPQVGRDDSHALVLYRFDEGKGQVIRDHGQAPALDLTAPDGADWLPERGLSLLRCTEPAMSRQPASKLRALTANKAFTVELWVSNPTVHPVNNRANILSWESGPDTWNFAVGHCEVMLMAVPSGTRYLGISNSWADLSSGFRTGLQHLVVTWDGRVTTGYVNGVRQEARNTYFSPQQWTANAPLLLGMHSDGEDHYLGTYYLAAIHDRCFTLEQVQRHYQAGPGAP